MASPLRRSATSTKTVPPDLAVGQPGHDGPAASAGRVQVVGATSGTAIATWEGVAADAYFGYAVAAAGDLDGDGRADVVAGAPGREPNNPTPYFEVRASVGGALLLTDQGANPQGSFGIAVAGLGDLSGDGVPEVAAGTFETPGSVRVYDGAAGALLLEIAPAANASHAPAAFGQAITALDDLDGRWP